MICENAMSYSRRSILAGSVRIVGLSLAPGMLRAAEPVFADTPFTLGVASGYPEPNALVLWTRLAPEPLVPGGGMPAGVVAVDWEIAEDAAFRRVRRSGRAYATDKWAHSVHVEATGLEPAREYWYRFTSGGAQSPIGRGRTAAAAGAAVDGLQLAVASCQQFESGHYAAYRAMADDGLDLVVHVGDYIYENRGLSRIRSHDAAEAYTLEDYRQRYALYKLDPHLQAAHAACAWMLTSDDHEVDNDYAGDLSEQRDAPDLFLARRAAAFQAYYEHLPLPQRMVPFGPHQRLHTQRSFGSLAEIFMLDGRQYRNPHACGSRLVKPCAALYAEERSMLGRTQEQWLESGLGGSNARWNLLGQQTVFAQSDQEPGPEVGVWSDGWSGYPAARRRLTSFIAERKPSNPVILSGDIHAFLVNDVHERPGDLESAIVATEFVTSSITTPGPPQRLLDGWVPENSNVRLARSVRGYTRLDIEPGRLHADLIAVDDVSREDSGTHVLTAFDIENGRPGVAR
jgi:alkaline phosphatase D